jgi:branched-chain amino acid transport system ATP-binding protein
VTTTGLRASDLCVAYGHLVAIREASIDIGSGELLGISGPNGAGKSTFLKTLAGVIEPASGTLSGDLGAGDESRRRRHRRGSTRPGTAYVPEGRQLFSGLSVKENLVMGALVAGRDKHAVRMSAVVDLFPRLGERMSQDVNSLSGGEKQMVAIGRALMAEPQLLLVDELSLGLAPIIASAVMSSLVTLNRETGLTVVLVDESLARVNRSVDRLFFMKDGVLSNELTRAERSAAVEELYFGND